MKKKDLNKIAPNLSKIKTKKTGFQAPENYFNAIEDGVIAEITSKNLDFKSNDSSFKTPANYFDSLEDILITKLKATAFITENNTQIPENYFENLEENVLEKIKSESKVISINKVVKYIAPLAIAASFLLIFLLNNNSDAISFDSLASSEIEEFIENGNVDFNAESLTLVFPDVELDDNDFISSISDSDVLDYLNKNEIEELFFEN